MGLKSAYMPLLAINTKVFKDNYQNRETLIKHGLLSNTSGLILEIHQKLTWADHLDVYNNLLVSTDATNVKQKNDRIRKKEKNEGINSRKDTLNKKAYELGKFGGIDVALIICVHGRYTTYRSTDYKL
jgi:hypothetical protein